MSPARRILVFDLDGTLIDSAPDLLRCVNAVLAEQGRRGVFLDDIRAMVGDGAARLIERGFADTGEPVEAARLPDLVARFLEHYATGRHALTTAFPGVVDTLGDFAAGGFRLAICTNKPYQPTLDVLEALGLDHLFQAVSGGDSFAVRKPDPGHLLSTLGLLRATPDEAVMIGDSANDIAVARGAGVPVIAVAYGYSREPVASLGADLVIDGFADLPRALADPRLR